MNVPETVVPLARLAELAEFRFHLRSFHSFSETAAEAAGISVQQYQLLQVIAALPSPRGAAISYLAERMFLRHNSTVELVDRAVRAGLVRRETDTEDLRRSLVQMTPEGTRVLTGLVEAHLKEMDLRGPAIIAAIEDLMRSGKGK